jgi:hypothetical protein
MLLEKYIQRSLVDGERDVRSAYLGPKEIRVDRGIPFQNNLVLLNPYNRLKIPKYS